MSGLSWFAAILSTIAALGVIFSQKWRPSLIFFGILYLGIFLLLTGHWPLPLAIVKLVAGWMAAAILGIAMSNLENSAHQSGERSKEIDPEAFAPASLQMADQAEWGQMPISNIFLFLTALLLGLVIFPRLEDLMEIIPSLSIQQAWVGLVVIGFGLLRVGFSNHLFFGFLGVLMALAGFELLYAMVQSSLLLAGLLAGIHLSLAFTGAYLLLAPELDSNP